MKALKIRTKRLERAIDQYFLVKAENEGVFLSTEEKDDVCDRILEYAKLEGKDCAIAPGVIVLTTKTKVAWITHQTYHPDKWRMITSKNERRKDNV